VTLSMTLLEMTLLVALGIRCCSTACRRRSLVWSVAENHGFPG
jgi:hypothetical protein